MSSAINSIATIEQFLQEVSASEKRASANAVGTTSHQSEKVDDMTEPAQEGERSKENSKDVKEDIGPASVDSSVAAKAAAARKHIQARKAAEESAGSIPLKVAPTGEDPTNETASVASKKRDGDDGSEMGHTAHPARVDNDELNGGKYASMKLDELIKYSSDLGNSILAEIANMPAGDAKQAAEAIDLAGQAGWELAGLVGGDFDKQAADALVEETLAQIIKTASSDAEKVAEFVFEYTKAANEAAMMDPAAMGGGMPPEAAMGGMPPEAEMGGMPAEGGGSPEIAELLAIIKQLGITPEELAAAEQEMAAGGGGGEMPPDMGGGMPPEEDMGGMPPEEEAAPEEGPPADKIAAANKGASERPMTDYIQELLARSRK